tara:strand:- start:1419 stop:2153 length:735 start_codon:yes stop_codon:yes gene_type:complete
MPYQCVICDREFQVRADYKSHYSRCKFDNKSSYESIKEGYSVINNARTINNLIGEVERLKEIISKLEKNRVPRKIKNINILEYLRENVERNDDYNSWAKNIEITYKKLKIVLSEGFREGLVRVLKEELDGSVPLISFKKKKQIYIYENKEWKEYTNQKLESLLYSLLMKINECWSSHEVLICGNKFEDIDFNNSKNPSAMIYLKHRQTLYGNGQVDKHAIKMYDTLYSFLKTDVNNILVDQNYI